MIVRAAFRAFTRPLYISSRSSSCSITSRARISPIRPQTRPRFPLVNPAQSRQYASTSEADEKIEEIQELYANATDEFEIASEETEKKTVYAADDRAAAQEELKKLKDAYNKALEESTPEVSDEIKKRVGQRIRELDNAVQGMEEAARED